MENKRPRIIFEEATEATEVTFGEPKSELELILVTAIDGEIKKFDKFEARLREIREEYSGLTIENVNDKPGYDLMRKAVQELRATRLSTEKEEKEAKIPFQSALKSIQEKSEWIVSEIKKIEDPYKIRIKEIDDEKDRIKKEKDDAENARLSSRTIELAKYGASFDGKNFTLEDIEFDLATIKGSEDEVYQNTILWRYKKIWEKNEEIRIEEQKKLEEKRVQFEKRMEELKKREAELSKSKKPESKPPKEAVGAKTIISSDSEKYENVLSYLRNTPRPKFDSPKFRNKMRIIVDFIDDLE